MALRKAILSLLVAYLSVTSAYAASVTLAFNASLTTGSLAGTQFSGTVAYDPATGTGVGEEFLTLTALDFTLLGATFTHGDLSQGGQIITENGTPSYFTGAFFPPPPDNSPVSAIAFGFGGPGVIGYDVLGSADNGGSGVYAFRSAAAPELSTWAMLIAGFGMLGFAGYRHGRKIRDRKSVV